jgi:hypothetical protein
MWREAKLVLEWLGVILLMLAAWLPWSSIIKAFKDVKKRPDRSVL